jgi:transposase-like protein
MASGQQVQGAFTSDNALLKLVYLVVNRISGKWTMPGLDLHIPSIGGPHNWNLTLSQLNIMFEERLKAHLKQA